MNKHSSQFYSKIINIQNWMKVFVLIFGIIAPHESRAESSNSKIDQQWTHMFERAASQIMQSLVKGGISSTEAALYEQAIMRMGITMVSEVPESLKRNVNLAAFENALVKGAGTAQLKNVSRSLGKGLLVGAALGTIQEALHRQIEEMPGDDFYSVLAKENWHFAVDLSVNSTSAILTSKGHVLKANLIIGVGKASGARVAKAFNVGIEGTQALREAEILSEEGELWGKVLEAYAQFATAKSPWQRKFWQERMLDSYNSYNDWINLMRGKHPNIGGSLVLLRAHKQTWVVQKIEEVWSVPFDRSSDDYPSLQDGEIANQENNDDIIREQESNKPPEPSLDPISLAGSYKLLISSPRAMDFLDGVPDTNFGAPSRFFDDGDERFEIRGDASFSTLGNFTGLSWGRWTNGSVEQFSRRLFADVATRTSRIEEAGTGYWLAGTPSLDISNRNEPSGELTYFGNLLGNAFIPNDRDTVASIDGEFSLRADFSSRRVEARIDRFQINGFGNPFFKNLTFSTFSPTEPLKNDGTFSDLTSFNLDGFGGAALSINGQFFGSEYDSVGGSFALAGDSNSIIGSGILFGERPPQPVLSETSHTTYAGTYGRAGSGGTSSDSRFRGSIAQPSVSGPDNELTRATVPFFKKEIPLSTTEHLAWGRWNGRVETKDEFGETQAAIALNKRGYWISGRITPSENIPLGGNATYNGELIGTAEIGRRSNSASGRITDGTFHDLTGGFSMRVDFGAGSLTSSLSNVVYQTDSGPVTVIDSSDPLAGTINRSDSSLSVDGFSDNLNILMNGNFYGTNADAVGGSFRILDPVSTFSTTIDANGVFYSTSKTGN